MPSNPFKIKCLKILTLVYSAMHNLVPTHLSNCIPQHSFPLLTWLQTP